MHGQHACAEFARNLAVPAVAPLRWGDGGADAAVPQRRRRNLFRAAGPDRAVTSSREMFRLAEAAARRCARAVATAAAPAQVPAVVGFVGLGAMGSHMARNLAERGVPLVVCDVDPAAADRLVAAAPKGARVDEADTPKDVADAVGRDGTRALKCVRTLASARPPAYTRLLCTCSPSPPLLSPSRRELSHPQPTSVRSCTSAQALS